MNSFKRLVGAAALGVALLPIAAFAQTDGSARMAVTVNDYTGASGTAHWTVVWVTTEAGAFIKSLRKQGPSITSSSWNSHCSVWYAAKAGSSALDGYSSATASNYSGTNSPVILTWNCRDAANNLVANGNYKFWVQYAEDSGQGPYTTNGLLWTKGPAGSTNNYANLGARFTSMQVRWTPAAVAPTITSAAPTATGTVGVPYTFTSTATGTAPITFTAPGLPAGLTMSPGGVISGVPTLAGVASGTITAVNGTLPNATQPFSINIGSVPVTIGSVATEGNNIILGGTGPANGIYAVLSATDVGQSGWSPLATNTFNALGNFRFTNALAPATQQQFYRLRVP